MSSSIKRVLVVHFSQTGQLTRVLDSICQPMERDGIEIVHERLVPADPYPFPWPVLRFFEEFPGTVAQETVHLKPVNVNPSTHFDLILIGYQTWFLSPSPPIVSFIHSHEGQQLLANKPVVTVVASRNMWLVGQEKMKKMLADSGARLLDNVAFVDQGSSLLSFITTPRWLWTGNKGHPDGWLPQAGVSDSEIKNASRFGSALAQALLNDDERGSAPLLRGLRAATVDPRLIASEKIANRSFMIWSKLLRKAGPPGSTSRRLLLRLYIGFLVMMILTVVPITMLLKAGLRPLIKKRLNEQKAYFEEPSGSDTYRMQE